MAGAETPLGLASKAQLGLASNNARNTHLGLAGNTKLGLASNIEAFAYLFSMPDSGHREVGGEVEQVRERGENLDHHQVERHHLYSRKRVSKATFQVVAQLTRTLCKNATVCTDGRRPCEGARRCQEGLEHRPVQRHHLH